VNQDAGGNPTDLHSGSAFRTRRWIKLTLLLLGGAMQLVRIFNVQSATGETPFLSANDRSRWCTVLSLTVNGSYVIDDVIEIRSEIPPNRRTWYTIDMVQHRGSDGKLHFYSSKPPLLPTIYAGIYWCVRSVTGATLTNDPFFVARIILIIANWLPMLFLWWLLLGWADRFTRPVQSNVARSAGVNFSEAEGLLKFVALAVFAVFGTFLSTFVVTLNNHLPAAISAAISLWAIEKVFRCRQSQGSNESPRASWFVLAGLATSFTAANELPAAAWVAFVAVALAIVDLRKTLVFYVPALIPVTVAFFGTNYIAHGTWRPAYSQRAVGTNITTIEMALPNDLSELKTTPIVERLKSFGIELSENSVIRKGRREGIWELWDEANQWRIALRSDGANQLGIYHWGDWYDYPNSYWVEGRKKGVDRGEPDRLKYVFHCLVGHHGILSLTPFWLFALLGAVAVMKLSVADPSDQGRLGWLSHPDRLLLLLITVTTVIVLGFYLTRPLEDRNYGGVCCGLRWSFWLIPLWFWLAARGMSLLKSTWGKVVVVTLLLFSIFSATYPWTNPWTSPWSYELLEKNESSKGT
jgi:hypothetical protein